MTARPRPQPTPARLAGRLALALLAVEVLDELVDGARGAAWPLLRDDLSLDYAAVGALLSVPALLANLLEPLLGVQGDRRRRAIVLGGGVAFAAALALMASAASGAWLMLALVLFNPASGAFVSLGQATLMDAEPTRREANMARWGFAGSLGSMLGPLALSAAVAAGLGWRGVLAILAAAALAAVAVMRRLPFPQPDGATEPEASVGLLASLREGLHALRSPGVRRSLALLEVADLLLDNLLALLALYFVDVAGASPAVATLAVAVRTSAGLAGDALMIALLGRGAAGATLVRAGAAGALGLFPAFLLAPSVPAKLGLLALLGLCTAPWYPVLKADLYASLPGRSGTVMAVGSVAGLVGASFPMLLGLAAERLGLGSTMWLLLAAPVALLLGGEARVARGSRPAARRRARRCPRGSARAPSRPR